MCDPYDVTDAHSFGERFQRAISMIDAENVSDPSIITVAGHILPKELTHARMMTAWVQRLLADPSEALLLAARAHHVRRWETPRTSFPRGRRGYLRWRRTLQGIHAEHARRILSETGYDEATITRVEHIIRKQLPSHDPDGQIFEDALTLVFLETQLHDLSTRADSVTMESVLRKTWRKISPVARELALQADLDPRDRELLKRAVSQDDTLS